MKAFGFILAMCVSALGGVLLGAPLMENDREWGVALIATGGVFAALLAVSR